MATRRSAGAMPGRGPDGRFLPTWRNSCSGNMRKARSNSGKRTRRAASKRGTRR